MYLTYSIPILTYASVRGVRVTLNDAYIHQGGKMMP